MNRIRISAFIALALVSTGVFATEFGRVISSTPVLDQTVSPQRQCAYGEPMVVQPQPSGTGAMMGGVLGGIVGNNLGNHGGKRAATTALGVVGGAFAGNALDQSNQQPQVINGSRCRTTNLIENSVVEYDVVYEYNGARYTSRMDSDPGRRIVLEVTVRPAMDQGQRSDMERYDRGRSIPMDRMDDQRQQQPVPAFRGQ